MCGIVGIVGNQNVAGQLYDGLTVLQHRGQDAAGIATANGSRLRVQKATGLVRDVFDARTMSTLEGSVGIAHVRYPTAGSEGMDEAQPFYVNSPYGIALAHNGNLINTEALRQQVFEQDRRNVNTDSDSEVLLNVFAYELEQQRQLSPEAAIRAVAGVHRRCKGGYAVVSVVLGLGPGRLPRPAWHGNLINTEALRQQVFEQDRRNVNTDSDSEVLLNVFAYELEQQRQLSPEAAIRAVAGVHRRCKGGYAVVSVVLGLGLVAFRDPHGIRPLVLGKRSHAEGDEYIVASESAALDVLGFQRVRDVQPGEALVITARGELFSEICAEPAEHTPCIFEYVYSHARIR